MTGMICCRIYLERYKWTVHCFFAVDCYYTSAIVDAMAQIGCPPNSLYRVRRNLLSREYNQGITFSNPYIRETVLVTGLTTSAGEFFNSLMHEMTHCVCRICETDGIDMTSEEAAYLIGDLSMQIFPKVRKLLCDHCRKSDE